MTENDDLRALFAEATSDVRPHGDYDDVRARAGAAGSATRGWFLPLAGAAVVLGLVLGGTYWATRDGNDGAGVAGSPNGTATSAPDKTATVEVYYVGTGATDFRLYREFHEVTLGTATEPVAAVNEAMSGNPFDSDYLKYWPQAVTAEAVSFDGSGADGIIQIRLSKEAASRPPAVGTDEAVREVQGIVRTAQAAVGATAPVQFFVGDQRLPTVLGVPGPDFTAGTDADTLALVQISNLHNGQTVPPGTLVVKGVANAFEANLNWELLVGGDAVVQSGVATAQECCTLAPYEFSIKDLEPGNYTIVVHDTDESGQGGALNQDTKVITVQ